MSKRPITFTPRGGSNAIIDGRPCPDPFGLVAAQVPLATAAELLDLAPSLGVSRKLLRRFTRVTRVPYVDGRFEGGPGKLFSVLAVWEFLPGFIERHERLRAARIAKDQARQAEAAARKAAKGAGPAPGPNPPAPKARPSPPPSCAELQPVTRAPARPAPSDHPWRSRRYTGTAPVVEVITRRGGAR
jgi:hypothetical protein